MALINRILVASDFSAYSKRAVDYGAALAAQFKAKLVIVHVYSPPVVFVPDAVIPMSAADMQRMLDSLQQGLDEDAAAAKKHGAVEVETLLLEGDPWHEIVRVAKDRGCDLIVLGTHGRGAVAHFFLGSVAEKVVRKAECPVLVARK